MARDEKRPGPGRPRLEDEGEVVGVRLPPELVERLDTAREVGQKTRSQWVRGWIERGLRSEEEKTKSFAEIYNRCADSQGNLRFYFKPGIFSAGDFQGAVSDYVDPQGQWLDARVLAFDTLGVALACGHLETFIPFSNIQKVTRRTRK